MKRNTWKFPRKMKIGKKYVEILERRVLDGSFLGYEGVGGLG